MLAQLAQRIHDRVGEEDGDGEGTGPILISDDCTVLRSFPLPSYRRTTGLTEMIGHVTKFYDSGLQNFPDWGIRLELGSTAWKIAGGWKAQLGLHDLGIE